jgi:hypothetical protein
MATDKEFKQCSSCGQIWNTREGFVGDSTIDIVGYQVNFPSLGEGLFLFNHNCRTTLTIRASEFKDLYDGSIFAERLTNSEDCPEYCLHNDNIERCPAKCECAYIREIIQVIRNWPKRN